jgi:carbonic anhydrase
MRNVVAASALVLVLAACGGGSSHTAEAEHGEDHAQAEGHDAPSLGPADAHGATNAPAQGHAAAAPHGASAQHWSYLAQTAWTGLSGTCGGGREQSPINLASASPMADVADLVPHYLPVEGAFVNNGHTLQFSPASQAATLSIGSDSYGLAQFHFHSPAEHTLDRRAYPAELHFVHRNAQGQLAVVGVFIEEGVENDTLAHLLAALPNAQGDEFATHLGVNLMALLPADRAYFAYAGSLTTPPCSEGVRWNVLRTPISASAQQIAALREALGATSRHVQPIGERTVLLGS